jgi:hypothetical protein
MLLSFAGNNTSLYRPGETLTHMRRFIKPVLVTVGAAAAAFIIASSAAPFNGTPAKAKAKTFCSTSTTFNDTAKTKLTEGPTLPTLPPLPTITLPTVTLPPITIPCIPLPTLPTVTLPTVTLPVVTLPTVTLPPITIPPITIPPLPEFPGIPGFPNPCPAGEAVVCN